MLSAVGTWLLGIIEAMGYQGIAFAMFLENIFPPIPSELIMPFGGFLAGQGTMKLWLVIIFGVLGTYFGVLPFYLLGRRLHKEKVLKRVDRRGGYLGIHRKEIELAFSVFHKRGYSFVLFGRFVPVFRTIISFPAGATKMHFGLYSLYTLLGSLIWCGGLAIVGYVLGDNWNLVGSIMKQYEHIILGGIALAVFVYFGMKVIKKF